MKRSLLDITQKISRKPGKVVLTSKDLTNSTYWIYEATGWRFVDILREIQYRTTQDRLQVYINTQAISGTDIATFTNIKLIQAPPQLAGVITSGLTYGGNSYDVKLYINGVRYYQTTHFTVTSYTNNILTLALSPGFSVDSGDEITITGKFIDIV